MSNRPRLALGVKICGLTRAEDARLAVDLGVDFVGLNFHPASPRFVDLDQARRVAAAVQGRASLVGVFVNAPLEKVEALDRALGLDLVQFHGDEPAWYLAPFGGRAVKVVRTRGESVTFDSRPYAAVHSFLFDVLATGAYGGTGQSWPYEALSGLALDRPYFVAGGIRPGNAAQALAASGASGLDVCSGVEASPGIKDPARLALLMKEVFDGFETPRSAG